MESEAEKLLDADRFMKLSPGEIIEVQLLDECHKVIAFMATAQKFGRLPIIIRFRALVEDWSRQRCIEECN